LSLGGAQHDQIVTAVDWAPKTNKIVTSSQDRNSYVWHEEGGAWHATLVLLRLTRSASCVKWSPNEDKFAVGSGEKSVCVCQFMADFGAGGGWTSKSIRKCPISQKSIKSTVLSVAWHPNNCFLVTCCADMKCRVFNAYLKNVDSRTPPAGAYGLNPANKKLKFGSCIAEYNQCKGWVHDAAFTPNGQGLAFVGHDSSVHFAAVPYSEGETQAIDQLPVVVPNEDVQTMKMKGLPFKVLAFIDDAHLLAAGHDAMPFHFGLEGGSWVCKGSADKPTAAKAKKKATSAVSAAKAMWANKIDLGSDDAQRGTKLQSLHQNAISGICVLGGGNFSTCGYDGRVVVWDAASLDGAVE
jgi:actin related protein 2/3 complex subunit 1A/1B